MRAKSSAAAIGILAREHELLRGLEATGDVVDDRLEPLDHPRGDERDLGLQLGAVLGRGRELRADDEQLALQLHEQLGEVRVGVDLGPGQAQRAHGLVDRAVGLGADFVLADPAAEQEAGRAVVAGARVDLHPRRQPTAPPCRFGCCDKWFGPPIGWGIG